MIIKHSIGGRIVSVKDEDSVEQREDKNIVEEPNNYFIISCKKCGLQHMLTKHDRKICCDSSISTDNLS